MNWLFKLFHKHKWEFINSDNIPFTKGTMPLQPGMSAGGSPLYINFYYECKCGEKKIEEKLWD